MERYLITSRGNTYKKNLVAQIMVKLAKIRPKISFFVIYFKFGSLVHHSLEHCLTTSRGKIHGKISGGPKLGPKLFLPFSQVASLYFLDIAQDCSLGQRLASSRAETFKKNFVAEIGVQMIFSIVMLSSVHLI